MTIDDLNIEGRETVDLGSDDERQSNQSNRSGVQLEPTTDIDGVACRISARSERLVTGYLTDDSGDVLERRTIATVAPGELFEFDTELEAGETYWILCDAAGRTFVRGRAEASYPIESESLTVTHGIFTGSGNQSDNYRYCIDLLVPGGIDSGGAPLDLEADDEAQSSQSNRSGVRLEATEDLDGVECRISAETEGLTTAYLTNDSGTVLEETAIGDLTAGQTFAFETELESGTNYWVLCDANGENFVRGRAAVDYPLESESLIATHGIFTGAGSRSSSFRYCIDRIQPTTAGADPEGTVDLGSDDEGQSRSNRSGVRMVTAETLSGLNCRISPETEGLVTAYLTTDTGEIIERQTIAALGPGDRFSFNTELAANEVYWVVCDARGRNYARGRAEVEYPFEADSLEITHGIYTGDGAQSDSYRYCIDRIYPGEVVDSQFAEPGDEIDTLDLGEDSFTQSSYSGKAGVRFETEQAVYGLECRLSSDTDASTVYLTDDDGNTLLEESVDDTSGGETVVFDASLEPDTAYRVVCDDSGSVYTRGIRGVEYPIAGDLVVATDGITSGGRRTSSYRYCIDRIQASGTRAGTETLDLGEDSFTQSSYSGKAGVRFETEQAVYGLECRLSSDTDASTVYLTDDDGNTLLEESVDDTSGGETVAFDTSLEPDTAYRVVCDDSGSVYTRGIRGVEYPIAGDLVVATDGVTSGGRRTSSYRYCIDRIRALERTGGQLAAIETRPIDVTTVNVAVHSSIDQDGDLSDEILTYLDEQDEVNHEFVLPEGSYEWNTDFTVTDPIEYLEIRGDPRARLQIRDHDVDLAFEFGTWGDDNPPQQVVIRNVDVDISDQLERDAGILVGHMGRCLIDNVELVGQRSIVGSEAGNRYLLLVNTRDEDEISMVRNVAATEGEEIAPGEPIVGTYSIGFSADPPHEGVNVWKQCLVQDYIVSGFYVRNSPGENVLEESATVNCGSSGIRLGAGDEARTCKIVLDDGSDREYAGSGLWLNGDEPIVERLEIDATDAQNDLVRVNSDADGGLIRDLNVFCGPTAVAPTLRCTFTGSTNLEGILVEDFTIEDVTTEDDNASLQIRRPDVTLRSGVITVENRPALGGNEDPELDDVEIN